MTMTLDLKIRWINCSKERSRFHVNGEIHHNVTGHLGSGVQADLLQHYFSFLLDTALAYAQAISLWCPYKQWEWKCYFSGTLFIDFVLLPGNMQFFDAVSSVGMYCTASRSVRLQLKPQQGDVLGILAPGSMCLLTGWCRLHHEETLPCMQKYWGRSSLLLSLEMWDFQQQ